MPLELTISNVVVVAHHFNPSIITQVWLIRNGLLQEQEFRPGGIFSDVVADVHSPDFHLLVMPQQCQLTPSVAPDREQEIVVAKVGGLVRSLPHTPFRAVGLNTVWKLRRDEADVAEIARNLFFRADVPVFREFADDNARFGGYMSKDAFGGRLKLDVKPLFDEGPNGREDQLQFAFNFHRDVLNEDNPVECIEETLHRWDDLRQEASRIVHAVTQDTVGEA